MDPNDRIAELEAKLEALTSQVERLTAASPSTAEPAGGGCPKDGRTDRRSMLRLVGAAAAGAVATAVGASVTPAAASNGITIAAPGQQVSNTYTGTDFGAAFLFQSGIGYTNDHTSVSSAVAGWATGGALGSPKVGVQGATYQSGGYGVHGAGEVPGSIGVAASGTMANLRVFPQGTAPQYRRYDYLAGDIVMDANNDLWLCTWHAAGFQPTFRKLAGLRTAGAFHAITPVRVYDSRTPAPHLGKLATGHTRVVSVHDARDLRTGAPNGAIGVPVGATAVAANVTIVGTTGSGYLAVNPNPDAETHASAINWYTDGQVVANGLTLTLGGNCEVLVIAGGHGTTHFIIDVMGYYQ